MISTFDSFAITAWTIKKLQKWQKYETFTIVNIKSTKKMVKTQTPKLKEFFESNFGSQTFE